MASLPCCRSEDLAVHLIVQPSLVLSPRVLMCSHPDRWEKTCLHQATFATCLSFSKAPSMPLQATRVGALCKSYWLLGGTGNSIHMHDAGRRC